MSVDPQSADGPEISVIIASFSGEKALIRCLDSIVPQAAKAEVLVATNLWPEVVAGLRQRFPTVRFLQGPKHSGVFALRSLAARMARGRLIALTEDHATVSPQWIQALIAAHRGGHRIIGGPIDNGLDQSVFDWALYFAEYGNFMPPLREGRVALVSGVNAAYDRELLMGCEEIWANGLYENMVHDALRDKGHDFYLVTNAWVRSHLKMSFSEATKHLFSGGRHFGRHRCDRSNSPRRLFWGLAAPLVPLVLIQRIIRHVVGHRPDRLGLVVKALPYLVCLIGAWSLGEVLSYWSLASPREGLQPARSKA